MKKAETQEQEFLEVCSSYDYDLLTGKREMTLKDYERITYLVSSLGYSQYLQFLIGKYMDLAQADEEREERENEIYLEYPEYYEDERILEEEEKWLEEFLNQLPEKKREYFEKLIKESELAEALKQLSERNRETLLMYYFLEMNNEEIAKKQNISRSGVFQNRHNSLALMKKLLKEKQ